MVNKNDTADLEKFFVALAGIIAVIIAFIFSGYYLVGKKYIGLLDAKISNYIQQERPAAGN